jgi:predicted metalloprotease with PDZ domain
MRCQSYGAYVLCIALFIVGGSLRVAAQGGQFRIDYTVEVASTQSHLLHVTADVKNIRQSRLDLSLPAWTPGLYRVENYARNVLRFKVSDARGAWMPHTLVRKQTWSVDTRNLERIKVEFDYRADKLAVNQAKVSEDFAFFTGTQIFLMAEGHRSSPSLVRFDVPKGWGIISALKETNDPRTFSAPDYDTLVDAPTQLGRFDVRRFEVEGKPHYFVAAPAGAFSADKAEKFTGMLAEIARTQSAIFGGLPYEKFVYFYIFMPPDIADTYGIEHLNSYVQFAPSGEAATPQTLLDIASHEFFHVWNVKRIRPLELWSYDYTGENETPLLWFSEGVTSYYGNLCSYRAGLRSRREFLAAAAAAIRTAETNEARAYISPAESSVMTWVGTEPPAYGISYYTQGYYSQGETLGALLDLSIRHDSGGKASLDDLMRALDREFYRRARGFSTEDLISVVNRLTGRDYHDFFRRYVWGVEVPPYDSILGYAGYRLQKATRQVPQIGVDVKIATGYLLITGIKPGTAAAQADLAVGDHILKIDGADTSHINLRDKIGRVVKLTIRRGDEEREVEILVGSREDVVYSIEESPSPSPAQLSIRDGWLRGGASPEG